MFTLENSIKFKIFRFLKNIFKKKFFTANNWINFKIAQKNYKQSFSFFFNFLQKNIYEIMQAKTVNKMFY